MKILFNNRKTYIGIALAVIGVILILVYKISHQAPPELVTTTAEIGKVRQMVSVSGLAKAKQIAELAFPSSGTVREVLVDVGDDVAVGDTLVTIDTRTLAADRQEALAALAQAIADRDELIAGPTLSARSVTAETLAGKETILKTTRESEAQKIKSAYRTLLSDDLTAYSKDGDEGAVPPIISGTYTCDKEGTYKLEVYSSSAESGYSYSLSGIETGSYEASTAQPISLGNCGLRIIFDTNSKYSNSAWYIDIPNIKSSSYVANRNAYNLAVTQSESNIALAEQAVTLAKADAQNQNAPARVESITRANANISQAKAKLNRIDTLISDRALVAPFAGVITEMNVLAGETVGTEPIITLLASHAFEVTARIPEIDIGKLQTTQIVEMLFDAKADEIISGEVTFISPEATEIDGVSYYEAIIQFKETPTWMRSGLNADIDIIVAEEANSIRLPKRFVSKSGDIYEVRHKEESMKSEDYFVSSSTVNLILEGNDGFMAISGINVGDVIVAP